MLVRTAELEFSHDTSTDPHGTYTAEKISREYNVGIQFTSQAVHHGFPTVRLYGEYDDVKLCYLTQWDNGSSDEEMLRGWAEVVAVGADPDLGWDLYRRVPAADRQAHNA